MIVQSLRPGAAHGQDDGYALVAGIGLLPCPLTISVLGFACSQSSSPMVALVLLSLALGISLTIGVAAVLAIVARRAVGAALAGWSPALDHGSRIAQGVAGLLIVIVGLMTLVPLVW